MIIKINEEQYRWLSEAKDVITEINHLANNSNITIASLSDFQQIVSNLGINDNNVEKYFGTYCFIEVGSSYSRINTELPHVNFKNGGSDNFYNNGQWAFHREHKNVLKLEFDDNQKFNNRFPKINGFDSKTPATAVKLSPTENKYSKNFKFYYANGVDFTKEMGQKLKKFVENNLSANTDVKFIIHCMQGKSRSAAIGTYIANKIGQLNDEFLSEYDKGDSESQLNIGINKRGQPKYPHKNVMAKMGELEGLNKKSGYKAQKANESIDEDVFVKGVKGKKANLTYNQRSSSNPTRNRGNVSSNDMLDTGKMDQNNHDTFIVPLKGGINSYNITSIKGVEVMHYFKNKYAGKKTGMNIEINGIKKEYELFMETDEFNQFTNMFLTKINNVVKYAINAFNTKEQFTNISIYPVPSSNNFNEVMCEKIAGKLQIAGLNTQRINSDLFKKDLTNLQKDTDFIKKNKEYYSSRKYKGGDDNVTHEQDLDNTIRKYNNTTAAQEQTLINNYNNCVNRVLLSYRNKVSPKTIAKNYINLVDAKQAIRQKLKRNEWNNAFKEIKYAKGPSIEKRSQAIWNIITPILGKTYMAKNQINIVEIEKLNFQVKNLTNDNRMGLKNYFQAQQDKQEEVKRMQNTILVIFDDNISGGATLSDICYQCKKLGMHYIVPITFGLMREKYSNNRIQVCKPQNGFNY